ncbi:hydroxypyruvate isomerase family protein [Paracoccus tegillarcae]|uniref:Hydroxypyruvate isomerase n=1 Tax=Paracoccus tegillarcae TaxID=1529068 RepID=A0A2K9ET06_9RHOB|nr:TIM barrel protein [Paracoccus tegillarcae]AUH34875.1 hydroxypyruvate isomerase [Paracoccus tegillarcae]
MEKFAANLTFLFTELPVLQRFEAARRAGFTGVELLFPYDLSARDLARAAQTNGLDFVLLNAPPPNWTGGARGFAADPVQSDRFRSDFRRTLRFAQALNAKHIHIMSGIAQGTGAHDTFIENLAWACAEAPDASLIIEPQNSDDMPGYFLSDFDLAAEVIGTVGAPNLGLQFDSYHAHRITGDVIGCWQRHAALIRHVQISGHPGRHEPDRGDFDLDAFMNALREDGYQGWIGAEYTPAAGTLAGLGWLPKH